MAIDGINSNVNNLNSVNNTHQNPLEKIATGLKINQAADDASNLVISEALQGRRSDLAQSLENSNQGIALTRIATDGLESQKDLLVDVRDKLIQANTDTTSAEGKDAIKQEVTKLVDQFKNISETTKFANQSLITQDGTNPTIDISTADETISVTTPNTGSIADDLKTLIQNTDFNTGDIGAIIDRVDLATNQLDGSLGDFGSAENQLASNARNSITEQVNLARANSSLTDIDFGKEIGDFSKTNIQAQIGYLVSTQANAAQEQNVRLLA